MADSVRVVLFGAGATGARVARQLRSSGRVDSVEIRDPDATAASRLLDSLGDGAELGTGRSIDASVAAVVIASPAGTQTALARRAIHAGVPVVTTSNKTAEVRRLLALDQEARFGQIPVIVGATATIWGDSTAPTWARHAASGKSRFSS